MTGELITKKLKSGNVYYYVRLNYKDPYTSDWKTKTLGTSLLVKGNKRKAETVMEEYLTKYLYLEEPLMMMRENLDREILLCDYMDIWLQGKRAELKPTTFETYTYIVGHIQAYFRPRNLKLIDVVPSTIDTYVKFERMYGRTNQKTKEREPLSVRTVRDYKNVLSAVFTQAMIDGLVKMNPVAPIKVHGKKNRDYEEEKLFLTEEEILHLLEFIAKEYPRMLGVVFFAVYYGMRRSELLGLKWSAIDFTNRKFVVNHTVVRNKTRIASDTTKTLAGRRELPLFDTAEKCLLQIKQEQEEYQEFLGSAYKNKEGYVFTWEDGREYEPDYISKVFKKAMIKFGRPELTFHKLRHSAASLLINKGWDIKKLQYWLGHTDTQTTLNIYSHFYRQRMTTTENDLNEITEISSKFFE